MNKSKVRMPKELEKKCHIAIHTATTAAAAAGAIPIPMSDAIPITAAQIAMIISLGKILMLYYLNPQQNQLQVLQLRNRQEGHFMPTF